MRFNPYRTLMAAAVFCCAATYAQEPADSLWSELDEVTVTGPTGLKKLRGATNTELISADELKRAACCNLGESFTTNPSVDVSYSDAATGARQIRLLGLSGTYVQMLTENIPNLRGVAAPYGLGYIAGPWMQSIQVSKGTSSVKNGYESITGQINIEMKKPQLDPSLNLNMYYDRLNKLEANADGNVSLGKGWSAGALVHAENGFTAHDSNGDTFADMPKIRQVAVMPRVAWLGRNYVFQVGARYIDESRKSGQITGHGDHSTVILPYTIGISTRRWEAFTKNAWMYDRTNDGNVALILSATGHTQDAGYGDKRCNITQHELYASLMYERKWADSHALSAGLSLNRDSHRYNLLLPAVASAPDRARDTETVPGAYVQYTYNLADKLIAMGGVRYDHSSLYGSAVTPRVHLRYTPTDAWTMHASIGTGHHSPLPLAEYSWLLASNRKLVIAPELKREDALNCGGGFSWTAWPAAKKLVLSAEYYFTRFAHQLLPDMDSDDHAVRIFSSAKPSRSHALQLEATVDLLDELAVTAAWRYADVRADYGLGYTSKPLASPHKGLLTVSWSPNMGLWQADVTGLYNGPGRLPGSFGRYHGYFSLNAQVTKNFRHWSLYIGGENLTGYTQSNPIISAGNPWSPDFDATMIYAPLHGANVYIGFRYHITKYL